jgi:hypothetical protein
MGSVPTEGPLATYDIVKLSSGSLCHFSWYSLLNKYPQSTSSADRYPLYSSPIIFSRASRLLILETEKIKSVTTVVTLLYYRLVINLLLEGTTKKSILLLLLPSGLLN